MSKQFRQSNIEKRIYLRYQRDGIWEISLGLFLSWAGLSILFDEGAFIAIIVPILVPVILSAKKSITLPRLGYVNFSPERLAKVELGKKRLTVLFTITLLLGVFAFWAFTGTNDLQLFIRNLKLLPFGFVFSLTIIACGWFFDMYRFVWYGLLVLISFIGGHFLNSDPPAYFLFPGIIILGIGLVLFISFVRKYPRQSGDIDYAE